jgi:hypothetical protein
MMATAPSKLDHYLASIVLAAAIVGGFFLHAKITSDRADRTVLSQVHQQSAIQQKESHEVIAKAQKDAAQEQKDLKARLALLDAQKKIPVVPTHYPQINEMIAEQVQVPVAQVQTGGNTQGPDTTLPTKNLRDFILSCEAAKDSLASCQKVSVDQQRVVQSLQDENEALKKEVAAEDQVAKGGSFWHRFGVGLGHAACGAAGTGIGAASGKDGVVVGAATFGVCELILHRKVK